MTISGADAATTAADREHADALGVVYFDGVCALCNGLVRFLIRRDPERTLRYASLQSDYAARTLAPHGIDPADLSAMVLLTTDGGREVVVQGPRAVLRLLTLLGGPWRLFGVFQVLPDFVLGLGYGLIAKTRYKVFGKYDSCPIPTPEERELFLDQ